LASIDFDLVVLGAGAAGMTAAFVAANEGLRVLLVEKTAQIGGTTSRSAGTAWVPGNFTMSDADARADVDGARRYLDILVGDRGDPALREQFLQRGPEALRYLLEHSTVRFQPCPRHMDYYPDLPGAATGWRPVEAAVYDGRELGKLFDAVKPGLPEFMVFGGMMVAKADVDKLLAVRDSVANFRHAVSLVSRYAFDRLRRYPRGTRLTMGNALTGRLLRSVADAGVTLRLASRVASIETRDAGYAMQIVETDRTNAADVSSAAEASVAAGPIVTTRAIVFAGGGFSGNARWRAQHMPKPTPSHTAASDADDASTIELAQRLGGVLEAPQGHNAWWFPSSVVRRADGTTGVFPHIVMDRAKPGLIAVGRDGRRFVNEGINYHEFSVAQYRSGAIPCWLVCDARFIARYGLGAVRPGGRGLMRWVRNGYLQRGATPEALAGLIGVDPAGLRDSIERMNGFAKTGEDADFGKGSDRLSRQNGDASHQPNPCLAPLDTPPYYAVPVSPADLGTSLGLATNENAQLLDAGGAVLRGLYACGNDMNSIMGGQYPAPGVTLGPALTFGYVAAMHAAGKLR
jgi:succinate dehydrogenase/fumarate reductase flavoprotein subunit